MWLERSRETLRYYGRVLAAGGLAGGYYALYASHYVPALRWIDGNLVSNLLLMAWAGVIIGVACWRRAETLGVAAIALAYYTSLLGPDSSYLSFPHLILAGASVFLTLRYGWKFVSYASLAGTYGTYAFSRLDHWAPAATGDAAVVTGYWAVFAFAVLWPKVDSWEKRGAALSPDAEQRLLSLAGRLRVDRTFRANLRRLRDGIWLGPRGYGFPHPAASVRTTAFRRRLSSSKASSPSPWDG